MTQIRLIVVFMSCGYCGLSIGLLKTVCVSAVGRETERQKERVRVGVGNKGRPLCFQLLFSLFFFDFSRALLLSPIWMRVPSFFNAAYADRCSF